jgi:hypothetical protein
MERPSQKKQIVKDHTKNSTSASHLNDGKTIGFLPLIHKEAAATAEAIQLQRKSVHAKYDIIQH